MVVEAIESRVRESLARAVAGLGGLLGEGDRVELVEVDADRVAIVRLAGPCASCPATLQPLVMLLDAAIRSEVPEIRLVELAP